MEQKLIKDKSNNTQSQTTTKKDQIDKTYTLNNIHYKLNKTEPNVFGNFYVDFSEFFNEPLEYEKYMKKSVSLSNDDLVEKKMSKNNFQSNSLKPTYFEKFHLETLFYIFYYMPRDALQNYAADELNNRKWRYNFDLAIWFNNDNQIEDKISENIIYFNPNEL